MKHATAKKATHSTHKAPKSTRTDPPLSTQLHEDSGPRSGGPAGPDKVYEAPAEPKPEISGGPEGNFVDGVRASEIPRSKKAA